MFFFLARGCDACALKVNPPTAYGMLTNFVTLQAGDYVVQNGANSAVSLFTSLVAAKVDVFWMLGRPGGYPGRVASGVEDD